MSVYPPEMLAGAGYKGTPSHICTDQYKKYLNILK